MLQLLLVHIRVRRKDKDPGAASSIHLLSFSCSQKRRSSSKYSTPLWSTRNLRKRTLADCRWHEVQALPGLHYELSPCFPFDPLPLRLRLSILWFRHQESVDIKASPSPIFSLFFLTQSWAFSFVVIIFLKEKKVERGEAE